MVSPGRISCCVPFCRRTRRFENGDGSGSEWICWGHWKLLPLRWRKAYFRAWAESEPEWFAAQKRPPRWMMPRPARQGVRAFSALDRIWDRMKRAAIERAL